MPIVWSGQLEDGHYFTEIAYYSAETDNCFAEVENQEVRRIFKKKVANLKPGSEIVLRNGTLKLTISLFFDNFSYLVNIKSH